MPSAEALAVVGEIILHVGTDEETLALSGPDTQLIDLGGRALLPGFVDPHNHVFQPPYADAQQRMLEVGTTTFARPGVSPETFNELVAYAKSEPLRVRILRNRLFCSRCALAYQR